SLGAGSYTITYSYTDAHGCSDSDTKTYTVVAPCETPTAPDFSICEGTPVNDQLFYDNGAHCNGDECCVPEILLMSTQTGTVAVDPTAVSLTAGTYPYVISCECPDSPCGATTAQGTLTVVAPCEATAPDFSTCLDTTLDDDLFITKGAGCSGPECCEMTLDYSAVNTSVPDTYSYTVTCECPDSPCGPAVATGAITILSGPDADAGANHTITRGGSTRLGGSPTGTGGEGTLTYSWTPTTGFDDEPSDPNPYVSPTSTTTYTVTVTDENGCSSKDTAIVFVNTPPSSGGSTWIPGDPTCFFDVDMMGEVTRVYVTCDDGRCRADYVPEDRDELNFLELTKGTRVTYERDDQFNPGPPRWIRMRVSDDPPPLPDGAEAMTEVYTFIGYTATGKPTTSVFFDRAVGMQLDYDENSLDDNTTAVGIAAWNPDTEEWEFQPPRTGQVASIGTATADVRHFSTFVVLATTGDAIETAPAPTPAIEPTPTAAQFIGSDLIVQPLVDEMWAPIPFVTRTGNNVTITATITNEGEVEGTYTAELMLNGAVVGSQDVTVQGGESKLVRFQIANVARGNYSVEIAGLNGAFTSSHQVNWWLIGTLIGIALMGMGMFATRLYRKKRIQ
ncbi:MAG: hypothetical protein JW846_10230, partial [Dehalococcoidia bacterium]|nr:hypothetical protein [Dehalococcoidia bacterium]